MSTFTQLICLVEESQNGGLVWSRPEFNWLQRPYLQQNISLKLRNLSRKSAALIAILLRIPIQFGLKDDEFSLPVNKPGLKNHMHFRSGWTFYLVCKFIVLSCRFINNIPVNIFSLRHCCWGWNCWNWIHSKFWSKDIFWHLLSNSLFFIQTSKDEQIYMLWTLVPIK